MLMATGPSETRSNQCGRLQDTSSNRLGLAVKVTAEDLVQLSGPAEAPHVT